MLALPLVALLLGLGPPADTQAAEEEPPTDVDWEATDTDAPPPRTPSTAAAGDAGPQAETQWRAQDEARRLAQENAEARKQAREREKNEALEREKKEALEQAKQAEWDKRAAAHAQYTRREQRLTTGIVASLYVGIVGVTFIAASLVVAGVLGGEGAGYVVIIAVPPSAAIAGGGYLTAGIFGITRAFHRTNPEPAPRVSRRPLQFDARTFSLRF